MLKLSLSESIRYLKQGLLVPIRPLQAHNKVQSDINADFSGICRRKTVKRLIGATK